MSDQRPLALVRIELDLPGLFGLARRRRLPAQQVDLGYLVHCQLGELFDHLTPKPFALHATPAESNRSVALLAYTRSDAEELREHAQLYADPAVYESCRWDRLAVKALPETWPTGRRFGIDVRTCPVVRKANAGDRHRKGAEVDAFLARCWEAGPGVEVDREAVYRDWLASELERHGGARLVGSELVRFRRARLLRRRQESDRRSAWCERPDARLRGFVEITDGNAFEALLTRGVGRHRAFGFGMLLLRPPGRG